ncbi:MAG: hypothetical protein HQL53_11360 [Magnetococcales bacterium]|nr:hypothetical protein [Magnetococcales bacterium]
MSETSKKKSVTDSERAESSSDLSLPKRSRRSFRMSPESLALARERTDKKRAKGSR